MASYRVNLTVRLKDTSDIEALKALHKLLELGLSTATPDGGGITAKTYRATLDTSDLGALVERLHELLGPLYATPMEKLEMKVALLGLTPIEDEVADPLLLQVADLNWPSRDGGTKLRDHLILAGITTVGELHNWGFETLRVRLGAEFDLSGVDAQTIRHVLAPLDLNWPRVSPSSMD